MNEFLLNCSLEITLLLIIFFGWLFERSLRSMSIESLVVQMLIFRRNFDKGYIVHIGTHNGGKNLATLGYYMKFFVDPRVFNETLILKIIYF